MHDGSTVQGTILPLTKTFIVKLPIVAAFRLFTSGIGRWWPRGTHSLFGDAAITCAVEEQLRGRIYEVHSDGRQAEWGRILAWEPPYRLVCSWYPGRVPATAQELEVSFQEEADGTRVTLIHTGWVKRERPGARTTTTAGTACLGRISS